MNPALAFLALWIDRIFGEFPFKHPVSWMGDFINFYEKKFYRDSILRGALLPLSLTLLTLGVTLLLSKAASLLPQPGRLIALGLAASTGIAGRMLHDSVIEVLKSPHPREALKGLVSRDTEGMTQSEIHKACIETYAENLSDGLVAPLFYLTLFGIEGLFLYKAVNTLDSMVGYRTPRYERFGKASARLDDLANYIPSRITGLLIALLSMRRSSFRSLFRYGRSHESPNAAHPMAAMAGALGVRLGGKASYHGKIKEKPPIGEGREEITVEDVRRALALRTRIDAALSLLLLASLSVPALLRLLSA